MTTRIAMTRIISMTMIFLGAGRVHISIATSTRWSDTYTPISLIFTIGMTTEIKPSDERCRQGKQTS